MNTLSWFIYFAGVFGSVNNLLGIFLFLGTIFTIVLTIMGTFLCSETTAYEKFWEEKRKMCAKWAVRMWTLIAIFSVIEIATPTRETMLAIAASQVGETMANTATVKGIAGDATRALEAWIKKQMEPEDKKK